MAFPSFPWFDSHFLSGDVFQRIAPSFFSPSIAVTYAGNRAVEGEVVTDVASFGTQLGILSDAILDLAGERDSKAMARLRRLVTQVEEVKRRRRASAEEGARDALDALAGCDPRALERLIAEYRRRPGPSAPDQTEK